MQLPVYPIIASLNAGRPVFMIVMGLALVIFTWRLAAGSRSWSARLMTVGSLMLAFGYAVILPGYEGGLIERFRPDADSTPSALGWHLAMMVSMNAGWLLFGTGIAMHAKLFPPLKTRTAVAQPSPRTTPHIPSHEPVR